MTKGPLRLPTDGRPLLELLSLGRPGPSGRFTPTQIEQIRRTVRGATEVMVKVTGGGTRTGAVAAHFAYISRKGELTIETDEGDRIATREAQKTLVKDWHLELSAGQYRAPGTDVRPPVPRSSSITSCYRCPTRYLQTQC